MNNSREDSRTVHAANAQTGADSLFPHLPVIQEDEEVICNPGNEYTLLMPCTDTPFAE